LYVTAHLRFALDHLIYEKSGGSRSTYFPIFIDRNHVEDPCSSQAYGSGSKDDPLEPG
jgi:hypothetical protein